MRERPILFSGPMVRAILNGTKTMTRRVVKPQPQIDGADFAAPDNFNPPQWWTWRGSRDESAEPWERLPRCPFECSRLWVRETWWQDKRGIVVYAADGALRVAPGSIAEQMGITRAFHTEKPITPDDLRMLGYVKKPSIFMPRNLSRITLEITRVRCERLQAIGFEDCLAEGVIWTQQWDKCKGETIQPDGDIDAGWELFVREAYRDLWDSINGKRAGCDWASNPWVWVIEFRRVAAEKGGA